MENKILDTTCIMCPMGCNLHIEQTKDGVVVTGNTCERGKTYGTDELTEPKRVLTTLVKTATNRVVPVKTTKPIPKTKIATAMKEIEKLRPKTTRFAQILIHNIAGTDANIVVTK